ncbi:MAG: hypothetical protein JKY83_07085 [Rhizobiaceae bacterium]|nr:hypothetical protein [Rhizobiaceae bacterium]
MVSILPNSCLMEAIKAQKLGLHNVENVDGKFCIVLLFGFENNDTE